MRLALAAALLCTLGASSARAQPLEAPAPATDPIDEPEVSAEPSSAAATEPLDLPVAEPYTRGGSECATLEDGATPDPRAALQVLPWGDGNLTLHARRAGSDVAFTRLCTAPCALRLDRGGYELAVSRSGAGPRMADDQPLVLEGGRTVIEIHYDYRVVLRVIGWVFFTLGAAALGTCIGFAMTSDFPSSLTALVSGPPIAVGTWIPFLILAFLEDSVRVQTVPL